MALDKDKNYIQPKINVGNLYFLQEEYENALRNYHRAEKELENLNRQKSSLYLKVVLNISRSYYELEEYERAGEYYQEIRDINPEMADKFNYLEKAADDEAELPICQVGWMYFSVMKLMVLGRKQNSLVRAAI